MMCWQLQCHWGLKCASTCVYLCVQSSFPFYLLGGLNVFNVGLKNKSFWFSETLDISDLEVLK